MTRDRMAENQESEGPVPEPSVSEDSQSSSTLAAIPNALPSHGGRLSPMLLLPLIVLGVVAALWVGENRKQGILVRVVFKSAGGITEDTTIKFRDVEVGRVDKVDIAEESDDVVIEARIQPQFQSRLHKARFWIVRPLFRVHEVSGLETLITGPYIAMDEQGSPSNASLFQGLDEAPVEVGRGLRILLQADRVGSVRRGSPILFRQFPVGSIEKSRLDPETRKIEFEGVIQPEYAQLVSDTVRFWNASGVDFSLVDGLNIQAESLDTLISGGVAFDVLGGSAPGVPAQQRARFQLFEDQDAAQSSRHQAPELFTLYFTESIRGLDDGAPVYFRGVKVGEVVDIRLEHRGGHRLEVPVEVRLDFDRVTVRVASDGEVRDPDTSPWQYFIEQGLRARLELGSLITGSLVISLDFDPTQPRPVQSRTDLAQLPTVPSAMNKVLHDLNGLQLPKLIGKFEDTLTTIQQRLEDFADLASDESKTMELLRETLEQISSSARSVRVMADAIERDPQSFIFGK